MTNKKQPSLKDIAAKAHVSEAAASLALRDSHKISVSKKELIKKIAKDLGYTPSLLARGLATGKTMTIGLVVSSAYLSNVQSIVVDLDERFQAQGYRVIIFYSRGEKERLFDAVSALQGYGVDGYVLYGMSLTKADTELKIIQNITSPIVCLDGLVPSSWPVNHVYHDKKRSMEEAIEHYYARGHRKFAFYYSDWENFKNDGRYIGFKSGLKSVGLAFDDELVHACCTSAMVDGAVRYKQDEILEYVSKQFEEKTFNASLVLCSNDYVALSLQIALQKSGLKVPEDVAIVGYDNEQWTEHCYPRLSSIGRQTGRVAQVVVDTLLAQVKNSQIKAQKIKVPMKFFERDSSCNV